MKKIILALSGLLTFFILHAQVIPVKNAFQSDIAKVVADYPSHFKTLLGELLVENPQSADYKSLVNLQDAEVCTVTKYSSATKEIFSWQALMLTTDNFEEATQKFRLIFNSLNNLSVQVNDAKIIFKGNFEKPTDVKKFTSVVFSPGEKENLKIRIELLLQAEMLEWTLKVLVYETEREDNERGPIKEN